MLDTIPEPGLANPTGTRRQTTDTAPQPCGAWIVAQTHPQAERTAAVEITRRGYATYLPLLAVQRRDRATHRTLIIAHVPLFPGYLFVALAPASPWSPIRYTPGVRTLLMACGRPEQVRHGLVEALQAGDDFRRSIPPPNAAWAPGAACRLIRGPLAYRDAAVMSVSRDTARITVAMFGGLQELDVPTHWLEPR
jgi:transcription antitermination factor NusG